MLGSSIGSTGVDQDMLPTLSSIVRGSYIESQPDQFIDWFFQVVYNEDHLGKLRYA